MEVAQISSIVEVAAKVLEVIGLMVPLAFVYLYWRTGSAHAFRHRIWRMLYDDTKVSDPCIGGYLQERTDLMALRQECGRRIRTVAQGQKVIQWLRTHDESSDDLRASREFFDLENLRFTVDDPKSLNVRRYAVGLIALTIAVLLGALAAVNGRVYFKITKTDTWFSSSLREEGVRDVVLWPLDDNTRITKRSAAVDPLPRPLAASAPRT